jgi:hypothetical protein
VDPDPLPRLRGLGRNCSAALTTRLLRSVGNSG